MPFERAIRLLTMLVLMAIGTTLMAPLFGPVGGDEFAGTSCPEANVGQEAG